MVGFQAHAHLAFEVLDGEVCSYPKVITLDFSIRRLHFTAVAV